METKKATTRKRTTRRKTTALPTNEVFSTTEQRAEDVAVPQGSVLLFVNGRQRGTVATEDKTVADFVKLHAQAAGIRTFSVYLDGAKADTSMGGNKLTTVKKVEIVAKDARG